MEDLQDSLIHFKARKNDNINYAKDIIEELSLIKDDNSKFDSCKNTNEQVEVLSKVLYDLGRFYRVGRTKFIIDNNFHDYEMTINNKNIIKEMTNDEYVEKILTTNHIYHSYLNIDKIENYNLKNNDDKYYPVKLKIYCDKDFDVNRIYSIEEVLNLVKDNKIIHFGELVVDKAENNFPNRKNKYTLCGLKYNKKNIIVEELQVDVLKRKTLPEFSNSLYFLYFDNFLKRHRSIELYKLCLKNEESKNNKLLSSIKHEIDNSINIMIKKQNDLILSTKTIFEKMYKRFILEQKNIIKQLRKEVDEAEEEINSLSDELKM